MPLSRPASRVVLAVLGAALLAALAAALLILPAPAPARPAAAPTAVTPALRAIAARHPERSIGVIVQLSNARADVEQVVKRARGRVTRRLPIIRGAAVRIAAADAVRLARTAGVRAVSLDAAVSSTGAVDPAALDTSFNQSIRSDRSWGMGGTGKGVGVAVIDTGIDGTNPDFRVSQTDKRSRVIASAVVNPAATDPGDTLGHGTHIAGLIAGNGTNRDAGDPLLGRYAGVAPDANLVSVKVDDGAGHTTIADVIAGVQFAVDFRRDFNIRVINLSLRSTVAESYLTDPLDAAVEEAWFAGIVVVAAAGNGGDAAGAVNYAPANDPHIITVGAVDDQRTKSTDDDRLAPWSSRGTTQDGVEKPDVVAPGARLVSSLARSSQYASSCPTCVVDGSYLRIGGTSMAAGVVSGAVADLLQLNPSWTPKHVKTALQRRSRAILSPSSATLVDGGGDSLTAVTSSDTVAGGEAAVDKVLLNATTSTPSDPARSTLLDPVTLAIDYSRVSWSRVSWSEAPEALRADWSRVSWSSAEFNRVSWSATPESCAKLERVSWSRVSWSSADMDSAREECLTLTSTTGTAGSGAAEPARVSWSTSFDR